MKGIDTNILVYAFDTAYPPKREVCRSIVEGIFLGKERGAVTTQVLAEFANAVTKKVEHPLGKGQAAAIVRSILASENWSVFPYLGEDVAGAILEPNPFWDSLIAKTFSRNSVNKILTENKKHFAGSGVTAINPFES